MALTKISGRQIKLEEIFSVERILAARGLEISSQGLLSQTLLQEKSPQQKDIENLFSSMSDSKKRRKFLRAELDKAGSKYNVVRNRYSNTFEWFIGALLVKKFGAFSAAFGLSVKYVYRPGTKNKIGDFDVLAVLGDMSLLYAECKSGGTDFLQIKKAIERGQAISTVVTVFIVEEDRELLKIPDLLKGRKYPGFENTGPECWQVEIQGSPNSAVLNWHRTYFVSSEKHFELRLQTVLRLIASSKTEVLRAFGPDISELSSFGFSVCELKGSEHFP